MASNPKSNSKWRTEFKRLEGAYAPSTMRSYYSDVEAFDAWCQKNDFSPFPATVETVCRFLEAQAPKLAPSTVRRRLYAIRKAQTIVPLAEVHRFGCHKYLHTVRRVDHSAAAISAMRVAGVSAARRIVTSPFNKSITPTSACPAP